MHVLVHTTVALNLLAMMIFIMKLLLACLTDIRHCYRMVTC
jgi:hypothetical protein